MKHQFSLPNRSDYNVRAAWSLQCQIKSRSIGGRDFRWKYVNREVVVPELPLAHAEVQQNEN